ncbi:MAG: hypothetical protein F4117_05970 [Acidimicrobiales bacterium]|nr:hypothetical protein [Acidimicrobiales bacterium]MYB80369.1 hypothetical protein [Acidimicrobiales bacterium]MYI12097.1 hypothetical protein [Acidimicrobiales bacterium]
MGDALEPTGLNLVDGLESLISQGQATIRDYCAASAQYIREATMVGAEKGKAAQIRLSGALSHIVVAGGVPDLV